MLKPGGYVIFLIKFEVFQEWYEAFVKGGFIAMEYPYIFGYDSTTLQDHNTSKLPQQGADYALVSYLPSEKATFSPLFSGARGTRKRNLAVLSNVPAPSSKLLRPGSRVPFYTAQKSIYLLKEVIDLFTPAGGTVMDLFSGTMTTAKAALQVGRECICIEIDQELFRSAVNRLRNCLPQNMLPGLEVLSTVATSAIRKYDTSTLKNQSSNSNTILDLQDSLLSCDDQDNCNQVECATNYGGPNNHTSCTPKEREWNAEHIEHADKNVANDGTVEETEQLNENISVDGTLCESELLTRLRRANRTDLYHPRTSKISEMKKRPADDMEPNIAQVPSIEKCVRKSGMKRIRGIISGTVGAYFGGSTNAPQNER